MPGSSMPGGVLTPRERAALAAVCDAFHPALAAEAGDDDALFSMSASRLGVPEAAERAIGLLPAVQQSELRLLLRLLDSRAAGLALARAARGITAMPPASRAMLLARLATSRVPRLRSGFQALKRLSGFLYYSLADESGGNRVWPRIGYAPSTLPPPHGERLRVTTVARDTAFDADVCIVGSGGGGGVAAAALAARGMRVVVLEAGPPDQAADFGQRELSGMQRLFLDAGLTASRDLGVGILAGSCLGGGTAINWQTSLRTPDFIRDEWAEASGCEWFASDRFTRALDAVEARLSVSTAESEVNPNNAPIRLGCEALGYAWRLIPRNARGCDAAQCGYCCFGCRIGGKQSTTATYLRDAQRSGDVVIVAGCRAERVTVARSRAAGVFAIARDAEGRTHRVTVNAPRVVVAAGGIQSPVLLLRSGLALPQLGRNLYLHPTSAVPGLYADPIRPWIGPPQTILCDEFSRLNGNHGFRLETAPAHPGLLGLAVPWTDAPTYRRLMQRCAHASAVIVLARDAAGGRVRVRRDGSARIDYTPGLAERALLARGIGEAARVHLAAGAEEVLTLHTRPLRLRRTASTTQRDVDAFCERALGERVDRNWSALFSAHQMGTCRIGADARSGVCDDRGEVFGVRGLFVADASAFPASSGVNPMITVMALASCVAESIE